MADFDTNFWGGGAYSPTDYSLGAAYPDWSSGTSFSSPDNYSCSEKSYLDRRTSSFPCR